MDKFYVLVVGSCDSGFIGPFPNETRARDFIVQRITPSFTMYVLSEAERDYNLITYGDSPLMAPEDYES